MRTWTAVGLLQVAGSIKWRSCPSKQCGSSSKSTNRNAVWPRMPLLKWQTPEGPEIGVSVRYWYSRAHSSIIHKNCKVQGCQGFNHQWMDTAHTQRNITQLCDEGRDFWWTQKHRWTQNIMLSKISQSQRDKNCMIPPNTRYLVNPRETEK